MAKAKKFRDAKSKLLYAQRQVMTYFQAIGAVVCNLRFHEDPGQQITLHALPDGTCLFNPPFIELVPFDQLASLEAHISFHTALQEFERAKYSIPWKVRIAMEHCLHKLLEDAGMPEIFATDKNRHHEWDHLGIEQIASQIGEPPPGIDPVQYAISLCPARLPLDIGKGRTRLDAEGNPTTMPPIMTGALAKMEALGKSIGQDMAGLRLLIGKVFEPKIDWRSKLRFAMCEVLGNMGRTFKNPSRRSGGISAALGRSFIPLPGPNRGFDSVVLVIDLSGSVTCDPGLVEDFMAEMGAILKLCQRPCRVIMHESGVTADFKTKNLKDVIIHAHGGGGTSFVPVYDLLGESKTPIPLVVWLTDLFGGHCNDRPPFPMLWVTGESYGRVPWGRHIIVPQTKGPRDPHEIYKPPGV